MLVGIASTSYALGQMEVVDDPERYHTSALMAVLNQEDIEAMLICSDADNLPRLARDRNVESFLYVPVKNEEEERTIEWEPRGLQKKDNPLWQTALICQQVFVQVKKGAKVYMDKKVAELETADKPNYEEIQIMRSRANKLTHPWTMIVTYDPIPNAMVHGFLPRHVFITTGCLERFARNKDQLAMVLSHELSHYILGHTMANARSEAIIKSLCVTMLSMIDPSGGLAGLALELITPSIGKAAQAWVSREHESEADRYDYCGRTSNMCRNYCTPVYV